MTLNRIAIVSSRYPSEQDIYAHAFVHFRAKEYQDIGYSVQVFVPDNHVKEYEFEGVSVVRCSSKRIAELISSYDITYIHLLNIYPRRHLSGWPIYQAIMKKRMPVILYLHGSEVQTTRIRRTFERKRGVSNLVKDFYKDRFFIPRIKRFVKYVDENYSLATPSKWMKAEAENELRLKLRNVEIIPNGIDIDLFGFQDRKLKNKNYKLVTIRPLTSKKYAVDKAIEFLSYLPTQYTLDIYGKGPLKEDLQELAKSLGVFDRVRFFDEFIHRKNLTEFLSNYSSFVATTRMDAQGVMMCEAMATGMIIVTSDNTAINEFVDNGKNGLCGNNLKEMARRFDEIQTDPEALSRMRHEARHTMELISLTLMAEKEIQLMETVLGKK